MTRIGEQRSVSYRQLRAAACCYVGLPLLVFLGGFLKWPFALIGIGALGWGLYRAVTCDNVEPRHSDGSNFSAATVLWVFLFTMVWTYLGGMNGYWYQSSDWNCRNPVYFDLIRFDWPVVYGSSGSALSYYIGHWLPPALFPKLFYWITGSFRWAAFIGRMALWVWSAIGLTIVIVLMFHFLKVSGKKRRILAVLIFVCFSGLDVLGSIPYGKLDYLLSEEVLHMEWWSKYQFTSITACVYWVFNQVIVPWIVTLCFLMEKDARNYGFYGVACLLCGPFPCVGIAVCMVSKTVCYCVSRIRAGSWRGTLGTIFSPGNLAMALLVFPLVAAYLLTNNALGAVSTGTAGADEISIVQVPFFSFEYWDLHLLLFLAMEVGCYLVLVFGEHRKNPLFYTICLIFVLAPYFHIGASYDFCMRVSVPAIFILMLYVNDYLQKHFVLKPKADSLPGGKRTAKQLAALALAGCFLLGMVTPAVEVYRGFYHVITEGTIHLEDMSIGTFDNGTVYLNFSCANPEETFFFRYLAR